MGLFDKLNSVVTEGKKRDREIKRKYTTDKQRYGALRQAQEDSDKAYQEYVKLYNNEYGPYANNAIGQAAARQNANKYYRQAVGNAWKNYESSTGYDMPKSAKDVISGKEYGLMLGQYDIKNKKDWQQAADTERWAKSQTGQLAVDQTNRDLLNKSFGSYRSKLNNGKDMGSYLTGKDYMEAVSNGYKTDEDLAFWELTKNKPKKEADESYEQYQKRVAAYAQEVKMYGGAQDPGWALQNGYDWADTPDNYREYADKLRTQNENSASGKLRSRIEAYNANAEDVFYANSEEGEKEFFGILDDITDQFIGKGKKYADIADTPAGQTVYNLFQEAGQAVKNGTWADFVKPKYMNSYANEKANGQFYRNEYWANKAENTAASMEAMEDLDRRLAKLERSQQLDQAISGMGDDIRLGNVSMDPKARQTLPIDKSNIDAVRAWAPDAEEGGTMSHLSQAWSFGDKTISFTPITEDGRVLSEQDVQEYLDSLSEMYNDDIDGMIAADANGLRIIEAVLTGDQQISNSNTLGELIHEVFDDEPLRSGYGTDAAKYTPTESGTDLIDLINDQKARSQWYLDQSNMAATGDFNEGRADQAGISMVDSIPLMTDFEIEKANKWYNLAGEDGLNEYMQALQGQLWMRQARADEMRQQDEINSGGIFSNAAAVIARTGMQVVNAATGWRNMVLAFAGDEMALDHNSPFWQGQRFVQNVDATVAQNIEDTFNGWAADLGLPKETLSGLGQFVYGVVTSSVDSTVSSLIGGTLAPGADKVVEAISLAIMGSEAMSTSLFQGLKEGKSPTEACVDALVSGAIETLTEKISWETIFRPKAFGGKTLLKSTVEEGLEEGLGDVGGWLYDGLKSLVLGHETEIQTRIDEAFARDPNANINNVVNSVLMEYASELGTDMLAGAASGGLMSSIVQATNFIRSSTTGARIARNGTVTGNRLTATGDGAGVNLPENKMLPQVMAEAAGMEAAETSTNPARPYTAPTGTITEASVQDQSSARTGIDPKYQSYLENLTPEEQARLESRMAGETAPAPQAAPEARELTPEEQARFDQRSQGETAPAANVAPEATTPELTPEQSARQEQRSQGETAPATAPEQAAPELTEEQQARQEQRSQGEQAPAPAPEQKTPQATPPERPRRQKATLADNKNVNRLLDLGDAFGADTEAGKAAAEIRSDIKKGKRVSFARIGQLWQAVIAGMDDQQRSTVRGFMTDGVKDRLSELGETPAEIDTVADLIGKAASGEDLTRAERRTLAGSKHGTQVLDEFLSDDTKNEIVRTAKDKANVASYLFDSQKAAVIDMGAKKPRGKSSVRAPRRRDEAAHRAEAAEKAAALTNKNKTARKAESRRATFTETAKDGTETTLNGDITRITDIEVDKKTGYGTVTVQVKTRDGQIHEVTADPGEIQLDGSGTAAIIAEVSTDGSRYTAEEANGILQTYKGGDVQNHINEFEAAYRLGWQQYNLPENATDTQKIAHRLGQQYAMDMVKARNEVQRQAKAATKGKGSVRLETEDKRTAVTSYKTLQDIMRRGDEQQASAIDVLGRIADALKVNIVLFESKADKTGRYTGADGYYDSSTNTIGIDLNAGRGSKYDMSRHALLTIAGHELTHYIENRVGGEAYEALVRLARAEMDKVGQDWDEAVERRMSWNGENLSKDKARSELVADIMSDMLRDETKLRTLLQNAAQSNPTLFQRITNFLKNLANRLKSAFGSENTLKTEANAILQAGGYTSETVDMWYRLLEEAGKMEGEAVEQNTVPMMDDNGNIQYMARVGTDEETGRSIYVSNFAPNTPKPVKRAHIVSLIQNVWSKQPIELLVRNKETGATRIVKAEFNPDYDPTGARMTDVGKLSGGTRIGNFAERRMALNLSDDYVEIIQESKFFDSENEKPGRNPQTHNNIKEWHYFTDELYYLEQNSDTMIPLEVEIDVKETDSGAFFYDFGARRIKGEQNKKLHKPPYKTAGDSTMNGTAQVELSKDNIPQSGADVNTEKQSSARNTEYMEAVENGDMTTAQRLVDEAAREAGYRVEYMYHGDHNQTNVLQRADEREDGEEIPEAGNLGYGIYFTPSRAYAERFGPVRKFYLRAENVADISNDPNVRRIVDEILDEMNDEDSYDFDTGEVFRELIERLDADAVAGTGVGGFSYGASEIAVQESSQAKLADPVTYDDAGNVIPLDERFKKDNPDIRYSARSSFRSDLNKTEAEAFDNLDETSQDIVASLGKGTKIQSRDGEMELAVSRDKHTIAYSARTWRDGGKDLLTKALTDNGHTVDEITDTIKWIDDALDYLEQLGTEMSENRAFKDKQGNYEQYRGAYTGESGYQNLREHLAANVTTYVRDGATPRQVLSTIVNNGDYPVNLDVTLICKKRVAYAHLLQRLIEDGVFDSVKFDGAAIATVNDILKSHGFETQCLGCFVESRRLQIQNWAEAIVEEWNNEVDKRTKHAGSFDFAKGGEKFTEKQRQELVLELEMAGKKNDSGDPTLGQGAVKKKMGVLLDKMPSLRKHLTVADLLTPQGMTMLRTRDQSLFSLVKQRYGAASPKIMQDFVPYSGEVAQMTYQFLSAVTGKSVPGKTNYVALAGEELGPRPEKKNKGETDAELKERKAAYDREREDLAMRHYLYDIGGARTQSFSDFMIENVFDYIQMFADLAARKYPLHGYTKEIVCLRLFGMTGAKWNGSLIAHNDPTMGKENAGLLPVEEASNGRGIVVEVDGEKYAICFDDYARNQATGSYIQSIGMKDIIALQLDPRYSANVGSITIGVSDKQIRAMLNNDLFRMVIPYHKSGMLPIYARLIGADTYNDYTAYQNTKVLEYRDMNENVVDGFWHRQNSGKKVKINPDTTFNFNAEVQRCISENDVYDTDGYFGKDSKGKYIGAARKAAINYVRWCSQAHPVMDGDTQVGTVTFTPKFSSSPNGYDFTKEYNYYKLLEDFNTYDNISGADAVQGAVQMNFPSEENALKGKTLEAYKQALRDTGLFTDKEIDKYAAKAQMSFKEIIGNEIHNRALYETAQAPEWEPAVQEVKDVLKKGIEITDEKGNRQHYDFTSTREERSAERARRRKAGQADYEGAEDAEDFIEKQEKKKAKAKKGKGKNVQASARNAEYMAAVETNDMAEAQRLVDEAAEDAMPDSKVRANGKLLLMHHGTKADFTKFDRAFIGSTGRFEGAGFNFTPYEGRAASYGAKVLSGYLDIKNPLSAERKTLTVRKLADIIKKADPTGDNIIANYAQNTMDYGTPAFVAREAMTTARAIWSYAENDVDIYSDLSSADPDSDSLIEAFEALDYDGAIHYDENGNIKTAIAFNSNQFKLAAPVTYDKNNKPIPLDERFNTEEPDIRYSARTQLPGANLSVWDYLADDTAVQGNTEAEQNALTVFRDRVERFRKASEEEDRLEQALEGVDRKTHQKEWMAYLRAKAESGRLLRSILQMEDSAEMKRIARRHQGTVQQIREAAESGTLESLAERMEKEHYLEIQKLKLNAAEEKKLVAQKVEARYVRKLAQQRADFMRRQADAKAVRDISKEIATGRRSIIRDIKKLDHLIRHETDYKNVPETYKPLAETMVSLIVNNDQNGNALVFDKKSAAKLANTYARIAMIDDQTGPLYDEEVMAALDELSTSIDERGLLRSLPGQTLLEKAQNERETVARISEAVHYLTSVIQSSRDAFFEGRKVQIEEAAQPLVEGLNARKSYGELQGTVARALVMADRFIRTNNMIPVYYVRAVGNEGFTALMDGMFDGESTYGIQLGDADNRITEIQKDHNYQTWAGIPGDKFTFVTEGGRKITLTREQALSIYAAYKREHLNGMESHHLDQGGIVFLAEDEGGRLHRESEETVNRRTSPAQITTADMDQINAWLTDEQKAYADEMVAYLSDDMSEIGNETSMAMFGIKKYKEKYYFPFRSYSGALHQRSDAGSTSTTSDARIKHAGFTNALIRKAATPLVVDDFTTVVKGHVAEMLTYGNFAVPIESMNRVLNHKLDDGTTVRTLFERKYGANMTAYLKDYLRDLNGGVQSDSRASALSKFISLYKKGAVVASLSVALQQPLSLIRAYTVMDKAALIQAHKRTPRSAWSRSFDEAKQYAGTAVIKDMGRFDTGVGRGAVEYLGMDINQTRMDKAKAKAAKLVGWGPETMDKMAWGIMWEGVKIEQAKLDPDANPNSEEFLERCGKRFDEVMRLTQVYDSTLSRSANMRAKDPFMKMVTSFMAEPTLTMNMLYDAFANKDKNNIIKISRTGAAGAFVISALLQSVIKAAMSAARRKKQDEDKSFIEKMTATVIENFGDEINPVNSIPGLRDVWSLMHGDTVDRADLTVVNELVKAADKLSKTFENGLGGTGAYENLYIATEEFGGSLAKLFGIPAKNILRDVRAAWNFVEDVTDDKRPNWQNIGMTAADAALGRTGAKAKNTHYERLYNALRKNDKAAAEREASYLTASLGASEQTVGTKLKGLIRDGFVAGDLDDNEAVKLLVSNGYSKTERDAYTYLGKAADKAEHKNEEGYTGSGSVYGPVLDAVHNSDWSAASTEIRLLASHDIDEEAVVTKIRSDTKDRYLKGEIGDDQAAALLKRYSSNPKETEHDRYWKLREWDYQKTHGKDAKWSKYQSLDDALDSGDESAILDAMRELAEHGVKQSTLKSSLTKWRKMREDAGITINGAVLMAYNKARKSYVSKVY